MFIALADSLHFGRASERLGCQQPALSRGIQRLEAELGVQLFQRDSRNVRLTKAGEAFRGPAGDIVERAAEAGRVARTAGRTPYGHLVLGVGLCGQMPAIGRLIRHFRLRQPGSPVTLRAIPEPAIGHALAEERCHALVAVDWAFPAGCQLRPLFSSRLTVALPAQHPLAAKSSVESADLHGMDLLLPCRHEQPMIYDHFRAFCRKASIEPVLAVDLQSFDQVLGTVAGGAAIALSPVPDGIAYPGIVFRPLNPEYPVDYALGWRHQSEMLDRLLEALDDMQSAPEP